MVKVIGEFENRDVMCSRFWFCAGMKSIGVYVSCDSDKCIWWFEDRFDL